ncbi:MAG TPA: hypothetical protein VK619_03180 [Pyrinomonadaceae bacterium]|nr:hypothetical protein [Pyrinomonadaceae bacterium]
MLSRREADEGQTFAGNRVTRLARQLERISDVRRLNLLTRRVNDNL